MTSGHHQVSPGPILFDFERPEEQERAFIVGTSEVPMGLFFQIVAAVAVNLFLVFLAQPSIFVFETLPGGAAGMGWLERPAAFRSRVSAWKLPSRSSARIG